MDVYPGIHFRKNFSNFLATLPDSEGNTSLHFCCRNGHAQLVELLIGAQTNKAADKQRMQLADEPNLLVIF